MQPEVTFFPDLGQLRVWWKPELNRRALIPQSRSRIICQAGNGKLQHFRGKARAKILLGNLLQCKSASYLSLGEIACNNFPTDAVSASNCFYCILKAFHTLSSSVLFKFYVLL